MENIENMENYYKYKAIKYKTKYLKLKAQYGGGLFYTAAKTAARASSLGLGVAKKLAKGAAKDAKKLAEGAKKLAKGAKKIAKGVAKDVKKLKNEVDSTNDETNKHKNNE